MSRGLYLSARVDPDGPGVRVAAERCVECGAATHHRKPYCREHVDRMPYVQDLEARLAAYHAEARGGAVVLDGIVAQDVLAELGVSGMSTVVGLARRTGHAPHHVTRVVRALVRAGALRDAEEPGRRRYPAVERCAG